MFLPITLKPPKSKSPNYMVETAPLPPPLKSVSPLFWRSPVAIRRTTRCRESFAGETEASPPSSHFGTASVAGSRRCLFAAPPIGEGVVAPLLPFTFASGFAGIRSWKRGGVASLSRIPPWDRRVMLSVSRRLTLPRSVSTEFPPVCRSSPSRFRRCPLVAGQPRCSPSATVGVARSSSKFHRCPIVAGQPRCFPSAVVGVVWSRSRCRSCPVIAGQPLP